MSVNQTDIYANISAAVTASLAAISTVGTLQDRPPQVLTPVNNALAAALAEINAGIAAFEADIDQTTVGGVVLNSPAPDQWPVLLRQANDLLQESILLSMRGYVGRAAANVRLEPA